MWFCGVSDFYVFVRLCWLLSGFVLVFVWRFSFLCVICGSRWICRRNWSESKSSNGWKMPPGNVQNLRPCFGRNLHPQDARPRAPTRQSRSLEVAFFAAPSFQLRWEMGLCKIPSPKIASENHNFGSIQREQRATHHYFCKKCFLKISSPAAGYATHFCLVALSGLGSMRDRLSSPRSGDWYIFSAFQYVYQKI